MITVYPFEKLGHEAHGWLDARHHFSFAQYLNRNRMGFGALRVINDDIVKAGAGFDTHPHQDMEIITYVRSGAITHRDSQGNEGRTGAGDVQVMSAGTGIFHSEYNLESEDTNLYQIWIQPREKGVQPGWASYEFPKQERSDGLTLLVSGDGSAPLTIHQDAFIYGGRLVADAKFRHPIHHQAYVLVSEGVLELDGQVLRKGDGAEIVQQGFAELHAKEAVEVLIIDVPDRPVL